MNVFNIRQYSNTAEAVLMILTLNMKDLLMEV